MIGYGLSDTEVRAIDRRSDGLLALAVYSLEADLVGTGATDVIAILTYDVGTDTYPWFKVVSGADTSLSRGPFVHFSGDGSRILLTYYDTSGFYSFVYFDVSTGAQLTSSGFKKDLCCGIITAKDSITVNNLGTKIYYII